MKKLITGLFAIAVFTFSASAQNQEENQGKEKFKEKHGRFHEDERRGMEVLSKLNLSETQKQQIKSINDEFKAKFQALNQNDNILVKDAKAQKQALMEERKTRIAAILTADQKAQLEQLRRDHKQDGDRMDRGDWKEKRKNKDDKEKVKVK